MREKFFIRVNVFGKTRYWDHTFGLHSGTSKRRGYQVFDSEKDARKIVNHLKKIFHTGITFEILPDTEIPFIKKQIIARKRFEK